MADTHTLEGVTLHLASPVRELPDWIGQGEVLAQLLAAWTRIDPEDLPLNPRLLGKPGVGKTTLAAAAARRLELPVFIQQATMDTRPEDLLVSPVLASGGEAAPGARGAMGVGVRYMASPLVSAMITGGALVLDEGNRMSEKSWASLAPLLDHRRYVESVVAGIKIYAHPDFRFVTTMNEDASTYELPDYVHSRLMPRIFLDFPDEEEERSIVEAQVPFVRGEVLDYVVAFLARAHAADLSYTVRDGINVARYAMKLLGPGPGSGAVPPSASGDARRAYLRALALAVDADHLELLEPEG